MLRSPAFLAIAVFWTLTPSASFASDFDVQVSARSEGHETRTRRTEEATARIRKQARHVMEVRRNAAVVLSWHAENTDKSEAYEDVLMHFFIVEEKRTGQSEVPKLSAGVIYEGALTMDFRPHDKADWRMTVRLPDAGSYLVRVETIGMAPKHGHEHFAAMDLVVR